MTLQRCFLSTKELAEMLRISPRTLEGMRLRGTGPQFVRLGVGKGARVVYRHSDVERWLLVVNDSDLRNRWRRPESRKGDHEEPDIQGWA